MTITNKLIKHGCHNQPRPVVGKTYTTWNGQVVEFKMTTECNYDKMDSDKNCNGCMHATKEIDEEN